jgi:hypothetical protein
VETLDFLDWIARESEAFAAALDTGGLDTRVPGCPDPETPAWVWWHDDRTVGAIARHQVQEAAVHRWDAPSEVSVAGAASDLVLLLHRRLPADELRVEGDRAVLDAFLQSVD